MSVHDDLSLPLVLPNVSLLSSGLLADEYGAAVVTLQEKHARMRTTSLLRNRLTAIYFILGHEFYLSFLFSKNRARDAFLA
jgi:hypothetical protein